MGQFSQKIRGVSWRCPEFERHARGFFFFSVCARWLQCTDGCVCRALLDAVLREKHGDVEVVNVDQQLVYMLSPQHQLEERVTHGLVPVVSPPHDADLQQVRDFLLSPFVFEQFRKNLASVAICCFFRFGLTEDVPSRPNG